MKMKRSVFFKLNSMRRVFEEKKTREKKPRIAESSDDELKARFLI